MNKRHSITVTLECDYKDAYAERTYTTNIDLLNNTLTELMNEITGLHESLKGDLDSLLTLKTRLNWDTVLDKGSLGISFHSVESNALYTLKVKVSEKAEETLTLVKQEFKKKGPRLVK